VPLAGELARFGSRPALVDGSAVLTYAELADRVAALGARLGAVRRLVLVAASNDVAGVVAYLAAVSHGHAVLLAADDDAVVDGLVRTYDPDLVVRAGQVRERRAGTAHELHPDLVLLLSTSGSTGSPRLVRLGGAGVQANAEAIATYLAVRPSDVAVTTLPLHYCFGLSVLHSHLLRGAAVVLTSLSVLDPCFWDLVRRHGVTSLSGVPHTFELLDRVGFGSEVVPTLRYLAQAGGRMPPERVRRYAELGRQRGFDLFVMYGQTEATARMAYLPPDLALQHPGTVGVAIPGGRLTIDAPDGEVGELVYEGPNVMLGYADSPRDLARPREVTQLRTGDLARRTDAGLVEVVGRVARFAKVFGLRIDLDRVERVLADDGWTACCASDDKRVVVAVRRPVAHAPSRTALRRRRTDTVLSADVGERVRTATGLPATAVRVVLTEEVPRLATGKPDPAGVLALATDPRSPAAEDVAATFALVLGIGAVQPGDSFVSLGGDSLSYVEASVRLEGLLGHLPEQWHLQSVAELELLRTGGDHRRLRSLETGVLLRALAIVAIVATHGNLWSVPGGAHLLLGLVGFNLARFQLTAAPRADRVRRLVRSACRVAVPSVLWLVAVTLVGSAYPWQTALLLNGVLGPPSWREPAWHLWFIEALVAVLLAVAALVAVPAVDRLERRQPFWLPVALAVTALATRYDWVELRGGDEIHRAHVVFWLVALGWATARATGPGHRALVTVLVVATVPGFFGDPGREAVVVGGFLALVWLRTVRVPAPVARACTVLAAASLWTYLTHWQVYPHLEDRWPWAAVAASLAVGIAVSRVDRTLERRRSGARRRVPEADAAQDQPRERVGRAVGGAVSASSPASSTGRAPVTTLTATGVPGA
jgi:acyl-CoA synthetase (AMP-forming)/AMP-acid ligase II